MLRLRAEPPRTISTKQASGRPRPSNAKPQLLGLQRTAGNRAVVTLLQRDGVQRVVVQRDGDAAPKKRSALDATAEAIVKAAQDGKKPAAERGVALVRAILNTYFAADSSMIKDVVWDASQPGLNTSSADGKDVKGTISVGTSFLDQATSTGFARRVIQVDHELEHMRQHRAGGMGGPKNSDLREFLAFHREALQDELPGTGRVGHGTRVSLIDEALRRYYKLSGDQQKEHQSKKDALLIEREKHNGKGGNAKTDPPSAP